MKDKAIFVFSKNKTFCFGVLLFLMLGSLRFLHLGYSEYISDELTAFLLPDEVGSNVLGFLLSRRKGPMQFVVSYIPFLITGDFKNELAERIPFAFLNTLSFIYFFLFVKKITKNIYAGFFAALIAGVNGLTTALGRIVQYQSLNMFFSFVSLYFFADLLEKDKNHVKSSVLAVVFFMLSFLSHWDALFVLPIIVVIYLKFLFSKSKKVKAVILSNLLVVALFSVFLVPFINTLLSSKSDVGYMSTRFGLNERVDFSLDVQRFKLYNPFFAYEICPALCFLGIVSEIYNKKRFVLPGIFSLWLVFNIVVFAFFIRHAGTHIYNVIFPSAALGGIFVGCFFENANKKSKTILFAVLSTVVLAFYYQTFMVIVDHKIEYPWQQERLFGFRTYSYSHEDVVVQNNRIGFPLRRNWKEINDFVNNQNIENDENLGYYTNESKNISEFYMDAHFSTARPFYAIGIRRPSTFVTDYKFSQIRNKSTVGHINVEGENKVRIYRVHE